MMAQTHYKEPARGRGDGSAAFAFAAGVTRHTALPTSSATSSAAANTEKLETGALRVALPPGPRD